MEDIKLFLSNLREVGTSPFAFVGYIMVLGSWLLISYRVKRNKNLLERLSDLPEKDRLEALRLEMGNLPLKEGFTPNQFLKSSSQKYMLIGYILTLVFIIIVFVIAVYNEKDKAEINAKNKAEILQMIDAAFKNSSMAEASKSTIKQHIMAKYEEGSLSMDAVKEIVNLVVNTQVSAQPSYQSPGVESKVDPVRIIEGYIINVENRNRMKKKEKNNNLQLGNNQQSPNPVTIVPYGQSTPTVNQSPGDKNSGNTGDSVTPIGNSSNAGGSITPSKLIQIDFNNDGNPDIGTLENKGVDQNYISISYSTIFGDYVTPIPPCKFEKGGTLPPLYNVMFGTWRTEDFNRDGLIDLIHNLDGTEFKWKNTGSCFELN